MPISEAALQNAKNRFVAVKGDATVGQAIAALQVQGGQPWWHLVVQMDDGSWGVCTFTELHQTLERMAAAADVRLGGWHGLTGVAAVEQDAMETNAADSLARKCKGRVLVVTSHGIPIGILVGEVSRGGPSISSAKLSELGGRYVNLKDYGAILLSSSKIERTTPKPDASSGSAQS
jgi:hypothetical protein